MINDDTLPKLALGTWMMGDNRSPNNDEDGDISAIKLALDNGVSLIDTAQMYADGRCEELVGRAIGDRPRDSYQILTKQKASKLSYNNVLNGARASLLRLGVDYIDYFVCHAPNADFDTRDFFLAANQLHKDGLIRHVGVSNFGPKSLQVALDTSDMPISLNQVSFSMVDSDILRTGTYDFCVRHNIPIQAYRVFARLKYSKEVMEMLESIAPRYDVTAYQLALAYINSYDDIHFTIKASSTEHWKQIKAAMTIELKSEDLETLRSLHESKHGDTMAYLTI